MEEEHFVDDEKATAKVQAKARLIRGVPGRAGLPEQLVGVLDLLGVRDHPAKKKHGRRCSFLKEGTIVWQFQGELKRTAPPFLRVFWFGETLYRAPGFEWSLGRRFGGLGVADDGSRPLRRDPSGAQCSEAFLQPRVRLVSVLSLRQRALRP